MNNLNRNKRWLSSMNRQSGWTLWSLMFILGIVMFFCYIGFQLVPVYTSNGNIKSAMEVSLDNVDKTRISRSAIIELIRNKLFLDGSHQLLDYKNDVDIKRTQRELIININYERRVHLFFNLSIVATFENEAKRDL